ncbi:N-acetylglucosaminyl-phosphatidylinositol de-N-acetylase-like isoform X2 [Babylonia areolata]|uniref:N-acetylglucosaminyl-phosphatidylinositol de-N-acetylase-like isoform X2 n=1 Tax=Babylonia areolata TaxID=304850 RepID=UPI003FCF0D9C
MCFPISMVLTNIFCESQLFAAVNRIQPQHIVTFDDYGVSGHANHITVSKAIRNIFRDGKNFKGVESVLYLESISVWRKYLGILDLPFTFLLSSHTCLLSPAHVLRGQRAMVAHRSQLEWFRMVYIVLSRYMVVNSFTAEHRTVPLPVER